MNVNNYMNATYKTFINNYPNSSYSKVHGIFSDAEMKRRLSLLRHHMIQHDIGGVLMTSYHNINYFSGFLYTAFGRPFGLVVTQDK